MKKNEIVFFIDTYEQIKIVNMDPLKKWRVYEQMTIVFIQKNIHVILDKRFIDESLSVFKKLLEKALEGDAILDKSISEDIGYLWNEELQDKPGLSYSKLEGRDYWVGQTNLVWSSPGTSRPILSTWIYNDSNGDIILEITPVYPWHFTDPDDIEDKIYMPYEDWIKTYTPFLIRKIPKNVAYMWIEQIQKIIWVMNENSKI